MTSPQQTLDTMRTLRLRSMADAYERQLGSTGNQSMSFDERLAILVEGESSERHTRKITRLLRAAKFPMVAAIEDLDFRASRGLDKPQFASFTSCEWIRRRQHIVLVGPTGVGKTWVATALGSQACRSNYTVLFYRIIDLYADITIATLDGSLPKLKELLIRPKLLILDDFGIGEMSIEAANVLYSVVDSRIEWGSVLITSQYPTEQWHERFPDPTLADAILDRITHVAHRINLKGESMRRILGRKQMKEASQGT